MTDTHLISGLVTKRAELGGEIAKLRRQLQALLNDLDAIGRVLLMVGYDKSPNAIKPIERRPGGHRDPFTHVLIDLLRETDGPMASSALVQLVMRAENQDESDHGAYLNANNDVRIALRRLRSKGIVERLGDGLECTWRLAQQ
ncbi:hypothetical protein FBZ89_10542 [Nitrospirillum amazonense]|uniref:Uncharacterized protein n=1 Tax=Nitrospirillum amazonense TaxID=28077 RepID=A0A560FHS9_9PROT|nr:hypothetical protein [Nitrospirillum amazonense]TWB21173.1 hypothetical protein FBZ89_10542 [Nitrospirillum amazonense]